MLGRMKSLLSVVLFASLSAGLLHGQTAESRHDEICGKYAEVPLPTEAQQARRTAREWSRTSLWHCGSLARSECPPMV